MSILKLIQRNITHNEKDITYNVTSFSRGDAIKLLSMENVGGGIIGFEHLRTQYEESYQFFSPPHFKVDLKKAERNSVYSELSDAEKQISFVHLTTSKSSIFPVEMDSVDSVWQLIKSVTPIHINILYQIVMLHKHDDWQNQLVSEYEDYLEENLQNPSQNKFLRKLQKSINEKLDAVIKSEYRNLPIEEFDRKIKENGFKLSIHLCLIGGNNKERKEILNKISVKLNKLSYMNRWVMTIPLMYGDILEDIKHRRLSKIGKNKVYCMSEILPFIMTNEQYQDVLEEAEIKSIEENDENTEGNNLISLLPRGEKLEQIDSTEYADRFNHALYNLKKINKNLKLVRSQAGATLIQLVFELQKNMRLSDLMNNKVMQDIQTFMGVKGLSIEQGDNGNEVSVYIPLKERRKMFLGDILASNEFQEFSKKVELPIVIGTNPVGNPIIKDLAKLRSLLVAGTQGSGKSIWLKSIILTLLLTKTPKEVQLFLSDRKMVEFPMFKPFEHVSKISVDAVETIHILKQIVNEMNRRYKVFSEVGVNNIVEYNKKHKNSIMSYLVIIIDEYSELTSLDKNIHNYVQSIAALGRASGCIGIIATQFPKVSVIPSEIKANLPTKVSFRLTSNRDYLTIFNSKPNFNLLGNGDGCISGEEFPLVDHARFQGCLITDKDESELIKKISKKIKMGNERYELPEVIEVEEESDIEKLKRCIVQNNECRVAQLQKLLKININKLNELMRELCDEGFLKAPEYKSQGYKLIASEEILNQYRNEENSPQP